MTQQIEIISIYLILGPTPANLLYQQVKELLSFNTAKLELSLHTSK